MIQLILNIEKMSSYDDNKKDKIIKLLKHNIKKDGYDELSYNTLSSYNVFKEVTKGDLWDNFTKGDLTNHINIDEFNSNNKFDELIWWVYDLYISSDYIRKSDDRWVTNIQPSHRHFHKTNLENTLIEYGFLTSKENLENSIKISERKSKIGEILKDE